MKPGMPALIRSIPDTDSWTYGYVQTLGSIAELLGGPPMGILCDRFGPKFALQVAFFGVAVHYAFLLFATSQMMVFLSQLPLIMAHGMMACQAIITLNNSPEDRAKALGRLAVPFALGMLVGAPLGGWISDRWSASFTSSIAIGSSTFGLLVASCLDSKTSSLSNSQKKSESFEKPSSASLSDLTKSLRNPKVRLLLVIKMFVSIALWLHRSTIALVAEDHFGLPASQSGIFMSVFGLLSLVSNVFLVGIAVKQLSAKTNLRLSLAIMIVSFALYSQCSTVFHMFVLAVPMTMSSSLLYTIGTAELTEMCMEQPATAIAWGHATRTFAGIVAPLLGSALLAQYGFVAIGLGACLASCSALLSGEVFGYGVKDTKLMIKEA